MISVPAASQWSQATRAAIAKRKAEAQAKAQAEAEAEAAKAMRPEEDAEEATGRKLSSVSGWSRFLLSRSYFPFEGVSVLSWMSYIPKLCLCVECCRQCGGLTPKTVCVFPQFSLIISRISRMRHSCARTKTRHLDARKVECRPRPCTMQGSPGHQVSQTAWNFWYNLWHKICDTIDLLNFLNLLCIDVASGSTPSSTSSSCRGAQLFCAASRQVLVRKFCGGRRRGFLGSQHAAQARPSILCDSCDMQSFPPHWCRWWHVESGPAAQSCVHGCCPGRRETW